MSKIEASTEQKTVFRECGPFYIQQNRLDCFIESNVTTGRQKKIDCFSVDEIFNHCHTVFEAMGCLCQEARTSLTDNDIMRGIKKREQDQIREEYIQQKDTQLLKCGSAIGGIYTQLMRQ